MNFYTQKYIYKITNKINGLAYIGQANDYERRFTEHRKYKVNQEVDTKLLYQAFEKYGIENFNFEVIGLYANYNEMERYWVAYYDTYYNGYNMTPGGDEPPVLNGEKNIHATHTEKELKEIQNLLKNSNLTFEEIGSQYRYSVSSIERINVGKLWRDNSLQYPLRLNRTLQANYDRRDLIINDLLNTKLSQREIAKKYNVSRSTITMINIGQNCQKEGIEYPIRKITDNCNNIKCKMYDINSNQLLKEFVSFQEASSFLGVKRADNNIRYALKKDGIAYGYRWEVEN